MKTNTEEKIKKLEGKIADYQDKINKCYFEIQSLTLEGDDNRFEGKYVDFKNHGYMFVTNQFFNKREQKIFFQGIYFNTCPSPYRDSCFGAFDAMKEFTMSPTIYNKSIRDNEIQIITKEEFINAYNKHKTELFKAFEPFINNCEQYTNLL